MNRLLFFLFISFHFVSFGQEQIVRDPLACLYGLKDRENNWLIPAKYQQLLLLDKGIYACQEGEKWGIIRSNGKKILSAKFEQIVTFSPGKYLISDRVSNNQFTYQKKGLIDSNAQWIFPLEYSAINPMEKGRFLLVKVVSSNENRLVYQSSIAEANGELLFPYLDGILLDRFYLSPVNLIGDTRIGSVTVSGNVRLVNASGKIISDITFDMGMPCGENFIVVKNNRYGLVNAAGKLVVPPKYKFEKENYDYSNPLFCLHGDHQFVFVENGKRGILNGQWKELVSAQYDQISSLNSISFPDSKGRYLGYQYNTKKYHLLDNEGMVMAEADTFQTRMFPIPKKNYYETQKHRVYYVFGIRNKGELRFGILAGDGTVLLKPEFLSLIHLSNSELFALKENTEKELPTGFLLAADSIDLNAKIPLRMIKKIDQTYLFENKGNIYPISYSESCSCWEQSPFGNHNRKIWGDYTLLAGNNFGIVYNQKKNTTDIVKYIDLNTGNLPLVQTEMGVNLLHQTKGFLFNENQVQINQQFISINRIWCQQANGKWKIYDSLGKLRTKEEFDRIAFFWETMIAEQNNLKGLLNTDCKWIIQAMYSDLFPVSKRHFVGITRGNHVSVIDLERPNVIDTSYTSFRVIFQDSKTLIYGVEKKGQLIFKNQDGKEIQASEKEILTQYWSEPNRSNYTFFVNGPFEQKPFLQAATDEAYSFFYPFYLLNLQQDRHTVENGIHKSYDGPQYQLKLEYGSHSCVSLSAMLPNNHSEIIPLERNRKTNEPLVQTEVYFHTKNLIRQNMQWKEVPFDALFNPKNKAYQNAVVEELEKNPDLLRQCSDPSVLFEGASHFSFVKDGVKLYFFVNQSNAFEITFSRKQIEQIPSAKWILEWI